MILTIIGAVVVFSFGFAAGAYWATEAGEEPPRPTPSSRRSPADHYQRFMDDPFADGIIPDDHPSPEDRARRSPQ